jgi:hypothetical protein
MLQATHCSLARGERDNGESTGYSSALLVGSTTAELAFLFRKLLIAATPSVEDRLGGVISASCIGFGGGVVSELRLLAFDRRVSRLSSE